MTKSQGHAAGGSGAVVLGAAGAVVVALVGYLTYAALTPPEKQPQKQADSAASALPQAGSAGAGEGEGAVQAPGTSGSAVAEAPVSTAAQPAPATATPVEPEPSSETLPAATPAPVPATVPEAGEAPAPDAEATAEPAAAPASDPATSAEAAEAGEATAAVPSSQSAPAAAPIPPSFDLVRIDAEGGAVIAGQAAPGAQVHVELDGQDIAMAEADGSGNFVTMAQLGASDAPRVLTLRAIGPDGGEARSDGGAIVSPVEAPAPARPTVAEASPTDTPMQAPANAAAPVHSTPAASAETSPASEPRPAPTQPTEASGAPAAAPTQQATGSLAEAAQPVMEQSATAPAPEPDATAPTTPPPAPITAEAPAASDTAPAVRAPSSGASDTAPATAPAAPAPPQVVIASSEGVRVVQSGAPAPQVQENVTLDAITYDPAGEVLLSGRGTSSGNVRVYLDNRPILTARIAEDGQWRTSLPEVESGVYTLRVDQLRPDGSVSSRLETPFKREDAAQLAAVAAQTLPKGDATAPPLRAVTIQPGDTLWQIATDTYGEGVLYVRIFKANRDRIRDPDLIYPGQVFALPK